MGYFNVQIFKFYNLIPVLPRITLGTENRHYSTNKFYKNISAVTATSGFIIGLTLKCQLKEVPLLSHRPTTTPTTTPTITSQFFGGKFKFDAKWKMQMQNPKCFLVLRIL